MRTRLISLVTVALLAACTSGDTITANETPPPVATSEDPGNADADTPQTEQPAAAASGAATTEPSAPSPATDKPPIRRGGRYTNEEERFAVTFPDRWQVQEDVFGVTVAGISPRQFDSGFSSNVNVVVEDLSEPLSVDEYAEAARRQTAGFVDDFTPVSQGATTLGGREAWTQTFTGRQGDLHLKVLQVATVREGKAYVLTYSSHIDEFQVAEAQARRIIDSFELL